MASTWMTNTRAAVSHRVEIRSPLYQVAIS